MDSTFGGVSFAPTGDNAQMAGKNAQLAGVPKAIQVLSMALPRVIGARPIAPGALMSSTGSQGSPVDSVLWQTILKTLGLPGGTAGPNPPAPYPVPNERGPEMPTPNVIPGAGGGGNGGGSNVDYTPHVVFQPNPTPPARPTGPFTPGRGGRQA